MSLDYNPRVLDNDEFDFLNKIRSEAKRQLDHKPPYFFFLGCFLAALLSGYLITVSSIIFWKKVFGFFLFLGVTILIVGVNICVRNYRQSVKRLKAADRFLDSHTVPIISIEVSRISIAKEYEDEGDWYIIECVGKQVFYFWDTGDLPRGFPFEKFEIYEPAFTNLTRRLVNPLGESIKPVSISKKAKWAYLKQYGGWEGQEMGAIDFDEIMDRFERLKKEIRFSSKTKK